LIVIVDYGIGNIHAVLNMLKRIGAVAEISADIKKIERADKLILPGVGSFDFGMENLQKSGLVPVLNEKVLNQKIPVLGICLGMQLMTQKSDEGVLTGLNWIEGDVKKFRFDALNYKRKIPHMGWNTVHTRKDHVIFSEKNIERRFYFVHSFYVDCFDDQDILTVTNYGVEFVSSFQKENIIGMQFHPEKSHKFGMEVMTNFSCL
jgi:glutamine amidotransferase